MNSNQVFFTQKCLALSLLTVCVLGLGLVGCQSAMERQTARQKKVTAAEAALQANRDAQVIEASKQVYATGAALDQEKQKSDAVLLAQDFNDMAQTTLGLPKVADKETLRAMVLGLLSTNQNLVAAANQQKNILQGEIVALQAERDKLQGKLALAEDRRDADYGAAAVKAASYDKWKRRLYWIVGIVGGGFVLSLILPALSLAFPALAPFANIFSGFFGTVIRGVFRIAPKAMTSAGVVGKEAYNLTENTLADVVKAINQVKAKDPNTFEKVLSPELKDTTTQSTSRLKIREMTTRLASLSPESPLDTTLMPGSGRV